MSMKFRVCSNEQDRVEYSEEAIYPGFTLLMDGEAFTAHIMDETLEDQYKMSLVQETMGNESLLESVVKKEIHRLTETLGFKLIFYFGKKLSSLQTNDTAPRLVHEPWARFKNLIHAPLLKSHLLAILGRLNVIVIVCDHEADQAIAMDHIRSKNPDSFPLYYCCSNNSKFMEVMDSPFIDIETLIPKPTSINQIRPDSSNEIRVIVRRRSSGRNSFSLTDWDADIDEVSRERSSSFSNELTLTSVFSEIEDVNVSQETVDLFSHKSNNKLVRKQGRKGEKNFEINKNVVESRSSKKMSSVGKSDKNDENTSSEDTTCCNLLFWT